MALIDDFKARFTEFETAKVDTYLPILEPIYLSYYNKGYSETTKEAVLNLVAHLLVLETSSGTDSVKLEASYSIGPESVSYQTSQKGPRFEFFNTTKYGQRFLMLTRFVGGVAV